MRLDKLLANLGAATRSECRVLVQRGRVAVNGVAAKTADQPVQPGDTVAVDGQTLDTRLSRHLMLYKPAGILTAAEDTRQKTVMELLPGTYNALSCMPVGRLDKDTTGLLLLTTDGELAHRLISPKRHVDKVYEAYVEGELTARDAEAFRKGISLKDFTALPAKLEILEKDHALVTVQEGKYHQVKRMFGALGKPVVRLHRRSFGPLALDAGLRPGEYRELSEEETAALYRAAGMEA